MSHYSDNKKLSKGLLQMKFMKKSKEKSELLQENEVLRRIVDDTKTTINKEVNRITTEPSFVVCQKLIFGRLSFQGMNPEIEKLNSPEKKDTKPDNSEKEKSITDIEMAEYLTKNKKNFDYRRGSQNNRGGKRKSKFWKKGDKSKEIRDAEKHQFTNGRVQKQNRNSRGNKGNWKNQRQ